MGVSFKLAALLFILALMASFLSMGESVSAQSTPVPSVPEFTVRYNKASYNITTSNNNETYTTQVDNSTVELVIKNQPITSTGNITYLMYYNVQTKSHFTQDWTELYPLTNHLSSWYGSYVWYIGATTTTAYLAQFTSLPATNSSFTILSLPSKDYPINTDFQVKALLGHNSSYFIPPSSWDPENFLSIVKGKNVVAVACDSSSDWSATQTVKLPEPSPNPTLVMPTIKGVPDENFPNNIFFITILFAVIIVLVAILFSRCKIKKLKKLSNDTVQNWLSN
jgi:hypothetical protein